MRKSSRKKKPPNTPAAENVSAPIAENDNLRSSSIERNRLRREEEFPPLNEDIGLPPRIPISHWTTPKQSQKFTPRGILEAFSSPAKGNNTSQLSTLGSATKYQSLPSNEYKDTSREQAEGHSSALSGYSPGRLFEATFSKDSSSDSDSVGVRHVSLWNDRLRTDHTSRNSRS